MFEGVLPRAEDFDGEVEVGAGGAAGVAGEGNGLAFGDGLVFADEAAVEVCEAVACAVAAEEGEAFAAEGVIPGFGDEAVFGGNDGGTDGAGDVDAVVEAEFAGDWVFALAKAGGDGGGEWGGHGGLF